MSVAVSFSLPDQPPAGGTTTYIPMGGDGRTAPFAAYAVRQAVATGDASSDSLSMTISMDPQFSSLVSYATVQLLQGTSADAEYRLVLSGARVPEQSRTGVLNAINSDIAARNAGIWHNFAPIVLPADGAPQVLAQVANVLSDVLTLDLLVYLFDVNVRFITAAGRLLEQRGPGAS